MISMNWNEIKTLLARLPVWLRAVVILVIAVVAFFLVGSCSTVKTILDGSGRVTTTVNQNVLDSTRISVELFKTN